jgi:hypothetical protein
MKRKIIGLAGVAISVTLVYGLYIWNQPARKVEDEKGIEVDAATLFSDYVADESVANSKYLNKAIEVTGLVTTSKKNDQGFAYVILQSADPVFGINCTFKKDVGIINSGQTITVKGICTAYLDDVIINQAILVR